MWMGALAGSMPGMIEGPKSTEVTPTSGEVVFRVPTAVVVAGRVLGPDGAPVAGARVQSFGFGIGGGGGAVSDAEGRYRLPVTTFGQVGGAMLIARAPGFVQPPAAMMVTGKADANRVIAHDVKLERAAVVTGRVVDREGKPLAGTLLDLRSGGEDDMAGLGALLRPVQAFSAEDGSFLVDSAPAGKGHTLVARRTGYVETASAPFAVGAGESVRVPDLVLREGAALVVRVLRPDGAPAAGARVQVDLNEATVGFDVMSMLRGDVDVAADERGVARVPNLKAGKATVTASARGFAPARRDVEVPSEEGAEHEVELRVREARLVSGRVLDEAGQPIRDATVRVTSGGDGDRYVPAASATTDADGAFRVEGLPEVPLTLSVRATGRARARVAVDGRRDGIEVRLAREDPDKERRRKEVMAEISQIVGSLQGAKDEAERKALQQRMQELSQEMAELGFEGIEDLEPDAGGGQDGGGHRR
jgi:protocatechuate 3,4-dioxygenase beta subunit